MEVLAWIGGIITVLGFLGTMYRIYSGMDKRVIILENKQSTLENLQHSNSDDINTKILDLRKDMKEQLLLFKEELATHTKLHTETIKEMKTDQKELVNLFRKLDNNLVKLNTTMDLVLKDKEL